MPDKVSHAGQQCDTTLTERFANPDCQCETYNENLGPCKSFITSMNGRCAYCDHETACHGIEELGDA